MAEFVAASRADPMSLVPAARAMYEQGKTRGQVLEAIYGVDLPREAMLLRDFARREKALEALWGVHPWELMIPLEQGGPKFVIGSFALRNEVRAYAQAPHVVLLATLGYREAPFGSSLVGYDLEEVRAGRSTIVGLRRLRDVPETGAKFEVVGPSLMDVFVEAIRCSRAAFDDKETREAFEVRRDCNLDLARLEALRREL
jgi:hypothetical protein